MADEGNVDEGETYFDLLNHLFVQDPAIDEVDIIFCPKCKEEQAKDAMVLQEHKLGLWSWCVKPLYMYAYNRLLKQQRHRRSNGSSSSSIELSATDLVQLSRTVVLLSAECYTVWNIRKDLVSSGMLSVGDDLQLSTLVLTKHPRSAETFSHRKWLINYYIKQKGKAQYCQDWLRKELSVCSQCAERYPDNYVGWNHRGWLVNSFIDTKKKLLSELQSMETWVQMHVSDHCGFHYRQVVIDKLKNLMPSCDLALLFLAELQLVNSLLESLPGHESVWYHRRFLFHHWKLWFSSMSVEKVHEFASLIHEEQIQSTTSNSAAVPSTTTSCWAPCVKSLRYLCRSAVVKMRPTESKLLDDVAASDWLPSVETERKYCQSILRGKSGRVDPNQQRLAENYIKWVLMAYNGQETRRVVHSEPVLESQIQPHFWTK